MEKVPLNQNSKGKIEKLIHQNDKNSKNILHLHSIEKFCACLCCIFRCAQTKICGFLCVFKQFFYVYISKTINNEKMCANKNEIKA